MLAPPAAPSPLTALGFGLSALLAGRLAQLHLRPARAFAWERQQLRVESLSPERGPIVDREGRRLAWSVPSVDLAVRSSVLRRDPSLRGALLRALRLDAAQAALFEARCERAARASRDRPHVLWTDLSETQREALAREVSPRGVYSLPGSTARRYAAGARHTSALGFATPCRECSGSAGAAPDSRALLARSGLEIERDALLAGSWGERVVEVSPTGAVLGERSRREAAPGATLRTSLDLAVMERVEQTLDAAHLEEGAAVVVDLETHGLLAVSTRPWLSPERYARGFTESQWRAVLEDPSRPLQDRAFRDARHPGRALAPFVLLATGAENLPATVSCDGAFELGARIFRCGHAHGSLDLASSLAQGCNARLYDAAARAGEERLAAGLARWGFGEATGLSPSEASGALRPRGAGHRRPGHALNLALGHGVVTATPVQLAAAWAGLSHRMPTRTFLVPDPEELPCPRAAPPDLDAALLETIVSALERTPAALRFDPSWHAAALQGVGESPWYPLASLERLRTEYGWGVSFASQGGRGYAVVVRVDQGRDTANRATDLARAIYANLFAHAGTSLENAP